jgi:hypothetical protein
MCFPIASLKSNVLCWVRLHSRIMIVRVRSMATAENLTMHNVQTLFADPQYVRMCKV